MRVIAQRIGQCLLQIGAKVARVVHQIQRLDHLQIGHPSGSANGMGRIGPAMANGAIFVGALLQNLPQFFPNDRAGQRRIG